MPIIITPFSAWFFCFCLTILFKIFFQPATPLLDILGDAVISATTIIGACFMLADKDKNGRLKWD